MTDLDTSVDQLTDRILDTIDTCRYRPDRAALRVQFMLHDYYLTQAHVYMRIIQPVVELWDKADSYCGNPVGEWGSAFVPPEYADAWTRRRAAELHFDARQLVREYLTALGGDQ
jgi:hypothetical protein